ncbi:MAG: aminodeoxychorismate/anthranilate synthase component II [Gemmatimonadales bacterium]|nr:MAG: aminodeoxychorismate/anthranilate synthase component II [Gemmatimonadales bacterium]
MILIIDNYDSFVFNIARYLEELGEETRVIRNDVEGVDALMALRPGAIVLSPGPGRPEDAGVSVDLIRAAAGRVPVLGVCLGHQAVAAAFGGRTVHGGEPVHGRATPVKHDGTGVFQRLPSPLMVGRYHSLVVDPSSLPSELRVQAWSPAGEIMAFRHVQWPIHAVQFHPESVLTPQGHHLLEGFLAEAQAFGGRGEGKGPYFRGEREGKGEPPGAAVRGGVVG